MRSCVAIAALLLALAPPASAQQRIPITIASVPSVPSASTYLALDKGYFRDAGLDVTVERINSLSKAVAMVATNRIQVAQGGISAGFYNAVAQGLPIIMALEGGSTPLYHQILVQNGLKDTIKTPADLKGRRVALSAPGSNAMYEMGMLLASAGLKLKDVDVKYIAFSQMAVALANGAVDAALMVAPFSDAAIEQKIGHPWLDPEPLIPVLPMTNLAYIANVDWIGQHRDVARRLFVALARAGRDYCQAYHRGPNRAEVIDTLVNNKIVADRGAARPDAVAGAQSERHLQPGEPAQHAGVLPAGRADRKGTAGGQAGGRKLRRSGREGTGAVRARQQGEYAAGLPVRQPR